MYASIGQPQDGLPYAEQAIAEGAASLANQYFGNLIASGDPAQRETAIQMLRTAIDAGWPVDPLAYIPSLVQQGDPQAALGLIDLALGQHANGARSQWEALLADMRASTSEVEQVKQDTRGKRDEAVQAMEEHSQSIGKERERVAALVEDVDRLVHQAAAEHLAVEYAKQAEATEGTARRYTIASLVVGALTVIGTLVLAVALVVGDASVGAFFSRATLTLPAIAFTAYLGALARTHRRMGWHWRHVELQIRTADPFIAPLEDDLRKSLLAALALRFFPGQPQDPQTPEPAGASDPYEAVSQLIGGRTSTQGGQAAASPAATPTDRPAS
jgi:hypothetical protein